ncbi:uncharacterized protein LOC133891891 isoform X2 [Phragmites australis]|uniref:uncharacterized protein LOC133891891 isoform X2 n=1 Tax=Phragmites australis TaxID=29695 RepID=UPI002D78EB28|nr:uncharacterized protein LOC133891891 isoform X2 [Phragmites australis]
MAEEKATLQSMREWVVEHKLRAVGTLWLSGIVGSIAYNWSRPGMKTSVKLIHARSIFSLLLKMFTLVSVDQERTTYLDGASALRKQALA